MAVTQIQRWFEHMDFEVPHTRVPVDGYPADGADAGPALPTVSAVQYNFSAHVVETGDKAAEVVEHALRLYKCAPTPRHGGLTRAE